jgi:hypothetical protein
MAADGTLLAQSQWSRRYCGTMKILIVDDHPIYRKGLIALLDQMEPDTAFAAGDGWRAGAGADRGA